MTRNLFLYWVGQDYKLILLLRELILLHSTNGKGYNVILINESNIKEYISELPDYFNNLCPAHQADFVRVHVICEYGGIWMDSDTLVLESLDSLFDILETKDGFFIKENNNVLWNGVFGSKKNTKLMLDWKKNILRNLNNNHHNVRWTQLGNDLLEQIYNTNPEYYSQFTIFNGLDNMYPVNWNNCVTEYIDKPYENYKNIIRDYQPLVVLVNSVYKNENIINNINSTPLSYFINKSLYNGLINNQEFKNNLIKLNTNLKESLTTYPQVLIGNLFYDHEQPFFYNCPLLEDCAEKRLRFSRAVKMRKNMFEIGLNGGHSALLALMSNKDLKLYSNDIAEHYKPCPNCHPEIYVPEAAKSLKEIFDNRFTFIKGSCLKEVPKFVNSNTGNSIIDIVHIDGEKSTYKQDFLNLLPVLADNALIIFDDTNQEGVQRVVDELIKNNYLYRLPSFPQMDQRIKYRNEILCYKGNNKKIFENIYSNKVWNNGDDNIPLSGPGSSIQNTVEISKALNDFIYSKNCNSIVDLGCGDLTWISKTQFFSDSSIKYTGVDIVESVISGNITNYPDKTFYCKDIIIENLDFLEFTSMIIIRDILFHLTNAEINIILNKIKNKSEYIAITSCKNTINTNIFDKWRFSEKNIHIEPFNINYNFEVKVEEPVFNRIFYIFKNENII